MKDFDFNKIKLIILDIDNTIANNNHEITEYTRNIIKEIKNKGIYVVLCSGRSNNHTIEKSKLCNASPIVISDNGAIIYNYSLQKVYASSSIKKDTIKKIIEICDEYNIDYVLDTINTRYKYIDDIPCDITQIVVDSTNKEDVNRCADILSSFEDIRIANTNLYNNIEKKDYYFCDITLKEASKGFAIKKLINILNIKENEVICFGDSMNDYTMLEASKYFIAMKNADKKLKEKAFMITEDDNDDDGVAKFINKYILSKFI